MTTNKSLYHTVHNKKRWKWNTTNFRFSPCIITVNHFYWPTKRTWLYKTYKL